MWDDDSEDEEERANTGRANNPQTMSRTRGENKRRDAMSDKESEDKEEMASTGSANNPRTITGTRGGKNAVTRCGTMSLRTRRKGQIIHE